MAQIVEILIAASTTSPVVPQQSIRAVPGRGLEGDRYFHGIGTFSPHPPKPDFEVTLIQQEHIQAFATASGRPFTSRDARRNLVTSGVDLNSLVGRFFQVGGVLMRGIRLCEPCNYLAKQTFLDVLKGLAHRGGLRAQILSGGHIKVGDSLQILPRDGASTTPGVIG